MYIKKSLIIVIVILSIVIIGLCAFIAYDKDLFGVKGESKKTNNTIEKKDGIITTEEIDVNSELVKSLVSTINKYTIAGNLKNAIPYSAKEVVLKNDMSDQIKGAIAFNNSKIDQKYLDNDDTTKDNGIRITDEGVAILKETFENLFGYDGFDGAGACPRVEVLNGTLGDKSYYEVTGCGYGPHINSSAVSVFSAKKDNDDIILDAKVVFAYWNGPTDDNTFSGIILSTDRYDEEKQNVTNKLAQSSYTDIENLDSSNVDSLYSALENYAKDNANLLDTYVYRFKKHNNNYYLYSVKKSD